MVKEEIQKDPWIKQEGFQVICFVGLFGDRRWEFIAKVSGLNRTGKSCRLRWVNYLQPGLKRGKMTPQEEKLVLELQFKWGNRWSRIARKLPGHTNNEIKNYWRTYMRKKTQKKKRGALSPSPSSSNCGSSASSNLRADSLALQDAMGESFYDLGDPGKGCSREDIWENIVFPEENPITPASDGNTLYNFANHPIASLMWQLDTGTLWKTDEEDSKMLESPSYQFYSNYYNFRVSFSC